ncbi:MAG: energy-coupling factor ABC transporter ATP-binding protein [Lachnospiraceae bacterium]|nr:energy-coupling factor ABC transporter ATP-binding protein [Lachnospiraceae bacterium]
MLLINNLVIEYPDGLRAINDVTFSLKDGENIAVIGANGAGKTSLLLSLVGILLPQSGQIRLGNEVLQKKNLRRIRSQIGMVFQNPDDQLFMTSIFEDVAFGPRSYDLDEAETKERVANTLKKLRIEHLAERSPLKLSGGEKRIAAIATVMAMEPEFLLFDEPTAFLDPRAKRNLKDILSDLPQGKLIATHDLLFAEELCSRVLLLQNGQIIADGGVNILHDKELLETAGL